MSMTPNLAPHGDAAPTGPVSGRGLREPASVIDASCRGPLVLLFGCGTVWLLLGTVLGIVASIKLHAPGFLAESAWLTVGRVRPASVDAVLYGFATPVSLGVLLWMLARLGGLRLLYPAAVTAGAVLWNFAVLAGVLGVLAAGPTGFEWLEMPRFAAPLLFIAFLLIAISGLFNFALRREPGLYVSQWYLVAALFWFAWVYSIASYLLLFDPVRGVLQAAVNAWFTGNFLGLWLTPVGLAAVFYFVPKLLERPLHSYWLAVFGFWTLAIFGGWSGLVPFLGGPLPRWIVSASVVANGLLVVSVIAVAWNWHATLRGSYGRCKEDLVLRFIVAGGAAYLLAALVSLLLGIRPLAAITQLTLVPVGRMQLALHGFVGLTLFGSLYYILPRMLQVEWPSVRLIRVHWLASVVGVGLLFVALTVGGLVQGIRLNNPDTEFVRVIRSTIPFLGNASLGLVLLLAGQVAFAWNLGRMLWRYGRQQVAVAGWPAVEAASTGGNA